MSWGPSRIREVRVLFPSPGLFNRLARLRRSFCFITRETPLKNVSPAVEGETTLRPCITFLLDPNDRFVSRRMSFPLHDSDKLIKQTYSVYVFLPEDKGQDITRKWHLSM